MKHIAHQHTLLVNFLLHELVGVRPNQM